MTFDLETRSPTRWFPRVGLGIFALFLLLAPQLSRQPMRQSQLIQTTSAQTRPIRRTMALIHGKCRAAFTWVGLEMPRFGSTAVAM